MEAIFKTGILVRDLRVEQLEKMGIHVSYRILSSEEYVAALRNKITEEAKELAEEFDREKLIYEFADLQEVMEVFAQTLGISNEEIAEAQQKKREKLGSFYQKYFTDSVRIDEENPSIQYYLNNPKKYPRLS